MYNKLAEQSAWEDLPKLMYNVSCDTPRRTDKRSSAFHD